MASSDDELNIPDELVDKLLYFQQDFEKMSEVLSPLSTLNINSTDYQIEPLDRARLNLVCGFALNSLFWMYLNTLGVNPKEHKIKGELERYKYYITHIKEIAEKGKAPKLDKGAAKRFVRNALWTPNDSEMQDGSSSSREQDENMTCDEPEREEHERGLSPSRERFQTYKKRRH